MQSELEDIVIDAILMLNSIAPKTSLLCEPNCNLFPNKSKKVFVPSKSGRVICLNDVSVHHETCIKPVLEYICHNFFINQCISLITL